MEKRILSLLGAVLLTTGAIMGMPVAKAFGAESGADGKYNTEEKMEAEDGGRTYPHGSKPCPECGCRRPHDKRIPPEWWRGQHPMPLPETEEGKIAEIPERPEGKKAEKEASASGQGVHGWYCMRNSTHTLPPIDRGMEFITECNAIYGDTEAAKKGEKVIYLTFDAGYENGNVAKILDVLKKHNAEGAFFVLENLIKRNPELVKRMADEGHLVCNHTLSHPDMTKIDSIEKFSAQVKGLEQLAESELGIKMAKFYRPPEGKFSRRDLEFAKQLGYKTVFWSFAYADWDNARQPSSEYAEKKILDNAHPGEIMLLHPTSATNAAVLDSVLTKLESEGYRFGSLNSIV